MVDVEWLVEILMIVCSSLFVQVVSTSALESCAMAAVKSGRLPRLKMSSDFYYLIWDFFTQKHKRL